ncbi:MAG: M23 family metallopeptidase [Ardenticatenaceae bacterium]|nr:M23 family metallopeptidase [Ardenticatenaceae bacterium]
MVPATNRHIRITNGFGGRTVFNNGRGTVYHEGVDYGAPAGTAIRAAAPGTALLAESLTVRGNTVFLDHGAGVLSGYFHMSQIDVKPGDTVQAGDIIGKVGATGLASGPHLHWEVRVNGRWVNPRPWLQRRFP